MSVIQYYVSNSNHLAVVLGTRFARNWTIHPDLQIRLDKTVKLYHAGKIKNILVCGKWTIWYDWLDITPPRTEARLMKDYLVLNGVAPRDIIQETYSKDTIGNIYYLNRYLLAHPHYTRLTIICASQRQKRVSYIVSSLLTAACVTTYITVDAPHDAQASLGVEEDILNEQKQLFATLKKSGGALKKQLYQSQYYTDQETAVRSGQRKNELLDTL